jgi:hypothetical protein
VLPPTDYIPRSWLEDLGCVAAIIVGPLGC